MSLPCLKNLKYLYLTKSHINSLKCTSSNICFLFVMIYNTTLFMVFCRIARPMAMSDPGYGRGYLSNRGRPFNNNQ